MAIKICLQIFFTDSDYLDDLSEPSSLEDHNDAYISQHIHPDHDRDSYIEEVARRTSNEHRERSLNKLTRTLGALPSSILEDHKPSKSPIFDSYSTSDMLIGLNTRRRRCDSFESDTLSSPITFAPPSIIEKAPHHHDSEPTPTPHIEIDSSYTTSPPSSPESPCSPMPQLHVHTHSTSDVPPDPNGPVAKSDWLVPLNEVVISIRRTSPSKPQSWTGEWNREMHDVIRDLRRL